MDLRDILLVTRAGRNNDAVVDTAMNLADIHRAHVQALCLYAPPAPELAQCYAIGEAAVNAVVTGLNLAEEDMIAPLRTAFRARCDAEGLDGDWSGLRESLTHDAPLRARLVDLVILGQPHVHDPAQMHLVGDFLTTSGAPCLIVPDHAEADGDFARIVIGWDGSRAAKRAIDAAMPFLRLAQAVETVIVGDPPQTHAADRTDAPAVYLARHGIDAGTTRARDHADAAAILLDRCTTFAADLLVMGGYGHSRAAEAVLGGVTHSVLRDAPIPLLMAQ